MSDLNKKNINYGALNRFYQGLKSHDLSDLNDKIDNIDIPEYVAGENIIIDEGVISTDGYMYDESLGAISLPGYYKQSIQIIDEHGEDYDYAVYAEYSDFRGTGTFYQGIKIYDEDNIEVGNITSYNYEDSETIYCNMDFKDGYELQTGYVYHFNIPYHTLQNQNEIGLCGFNNSHKLQDDKSTLLSVGLTQANGTSLQNTGGNALEIMGNGDMYVIGVGGYNGFETNAQLATKKTLQTVIGEKADSSALSSKANKVDYVVQLNPMTQQYDWTSLNSVTETGVYRISIEVDMMGTVMKMVAGDLFVQNTGTALVQTILLPSDDSIASHVRTSSNGGTSWTDSDVIVPSINDSATTSLTETYSIDKINSLISALDSRLTAIGG